MSAMVRTVRLTAAEQFWYIVGCIGFGAMYFAKVPAKKALSEAGLAEMTGAEQFWYVLQCIAFGAGYFAKVPVKKALSEVAVTPSAPYGPGAGYQADAQPYRDYGPRPIDRGQPGPSAPFPDERRPARHDGRSQPGW